MVYEFTAMEHKRQIHVERLSINSVDSIAPSDLLERRSFTELLSKSTRLLEESFGELESEADGLDFFPSQLQGTISYEQNSLNENVVAGDYWDWDDDDPHDRERMKAKSFVTDHIESFDERLKRKMSESTAAAATEVPPPPHLPALPIVERNSRHSVTVQGTSIMEEMTDSDSSECESTKMSSNDRDGGLDNNTSESPKAFSSSIGRDRLDRKIKARKAVEDRLRRSQSARPPTHATPDSIHPKLSSKELFQERMEKKMGESATDDMRATREASPRRHPKLSAKESFEERLKKKMSESALGESTSLVKPSRLPSRTSQNMTAQESFEQRLKKKMSQSATAILMRPSNPGPTPLPSTAKPDKSNAKGSSAQQSRKLKASVSFKGHDRLDSKIRAREAIEERLNRKMSQSITVMHSGPLKLKPSLQPPDISPKLSAKESFEGRLMKKMSESASGESTSPAEPSRLPPRTSQNMTAKESFEQRLKKKMSQPATAILMDTPLSPNAKPDKSNIKGISGQQYRKLTAKESFEARMKKKMSESDTVVRTNVPPSPSPLPPGTMPEDRSTGSITFPQSQKLKAFEERIQKKRSESVDDIEERSSNNNDRLNGKLRRRKAVEDRPKMKTGGHAEEVPSEKPISPIESQDTAARESKIQGSKKKQVDVLDVTVKGEARNNTPPAQESSDSQTGCCVMCLDFPCTHVFFPCGHMCACWQCSNLVMEGTGKCPMCAETVIMVTRVRNSILN